MFLDKLYHRKDSSITMSAPEDYLLHGVKIRKLPVGTYIEVMRTLSDLPSRVVEKALPNCETAEDILRFFAQFDKDRLMQLIMGLMASVPEEFCKIVSALLDVPAERMLDPDTDNPLGLNELAEVVEAFWKQNDMSDFFGTVRRLAATVGKQNTGSSDGLPSDKQSA